MTSSQVIITGLIWSLTAAGGFFSLRALLRRRRAGKNRPPVN